MTTMLFALFSTAHAQEVEPAPAPATARVKYKDRTELDFDGVELTAGVNGPDGVLVTTPRQKDYPPMIQLRANFTKEMLSSVDTVK